MEIHRLVHIDAETVERALEVMQTSLSGGEEAITFAVPMMKSDFEP